jgi:tetratricopeptide (TPR) repeat protein
VRTTTSPDDSEKAVGFYERAVQLDPAFALAWARLSRANAHVYFGGLDSTTARRDATERALNTAQKLQPNSPETLLAQAYYQYWVRRDYELAKATFGRVRELVPGSSDVPGALALIARRQGRWDESVAYWEHPCARSTQHETLSSKPSQRAIPLSAMIRKKGIVARSWIPTLF